MEPVTPSSLDHTCEALKSSGRGIIAVMTPRQLITALVTAVIHPLGTYSILISKINYSKPNICLYLSNEFLYDILQCS